MSIRFRCPQCNSVIKVSERHAGQKGKCSTCRAKLIVPTVAEAAAMAAKDKIEPTVTLPTIPKPGDQPEPTVRGMEIPPGELQRQIAKATAKPVEEVADVAPVNEVPVDDVAPVEKATEVADVAEVDQRPEYDEPVYEDEDLAPIPAPAISTREGNDILSAVAINTDLVHIYDDDDHDHAPSLIKKSVGLEGVEELVDMTAMVDIVFFLLIFFMMTTMQNVNSSIDTPTPDPDKVAASKAASSNAAESDADVTIRIEADNSLKFDGEPIFGEKELRSRLAVAFPGGGGTKKLTVLGHGDSLHGTVVMVLDSAHDTQIQDIRVAVQDEEQ